MNRLKVNVGDMLVGVHLDRAVPEVVTVQRVTPSGRIVLGEYPEQQYESLSNEGRVRGLPSGAPYRVRALHGEESFESVRTRRQQWVAEQAAILARHQQVQAIRRQMAELEDRLPSVLGRSQATPTYSYEQSDLDAISDLLTRLIDATPKKVRR